MASSPQDQLHVVNPTEQVFSVRWSGYSYSLNPHQRIIWPRFLAEHFAKKLTDHILLSREYQAELEYKKSGRPMSEFIPPALLKNKVERPKVVNSILTGVYNYYRPQGKDAGAAQLQQQIDAWNTADTNQERDKAVDMGAAADPLLGVLSDDEDEPNGEPEPAQPAVPLAPTQPSMPDNPPVANTPPAPVAPVLPPQEPPTSTEPEAPAETAQARRSRLFSEAKKLGIKTSPSMSNEQLEGVIKKQFA